MIDQTGRMIYVKIDEYSLPSHLAAKFGSRFRVKDVGLTGSGGRRVQVNAFIFSDCQDAQFVGNNVVVNVSGEVITILANLVYKITDTSGCEIERNSKLCLNCLSIVDSKESRDFNGKPHDAYVCECGNVFIATKRQLTAAKKSDRNLKNANFPAKDKKKYRKRTPSIDRTWKAQPRA